MEEFFLRKVTEEDVMLIYQWANDPEVRCNSFQTKPIAFEEHTRWYDAKMKSERSLFYILMCGNIPAGQIRLELDQGEAQVNYSISSEFRGKGLGKEMLRLAEEELRKNHQEIVRLVAEVKEANLASQKAFERENYQKKYIVYEKELFNE